jgi:hypothetical protein
MRVVGRTARLSPPAGPVKIVVEDNNRFLAMRLAILSFGHAAARQKSAAC